MKKAPWVFIAPAIALLGLLFYVYAGPRPPAPEPVLLTLYIHDQCGGCGVDVPGCGDCKDMDLLHLLIKSQLGDRLYDGSIEYRMFNTRFTAQEQNRTLRSEQYGAPQGIRHIRPVAFIGTQEAGLYLFGEALMPYVGGMLDRYVAGEDMEWIQQEIDMLWERLEP